MKRLKLFGAVAFITMLGGCASPVSFSDGLRNRVFIPCTDDAFCFRNTYGIAQERNCNEFPVTFRNNEYEYRSNKYEWIYQTKELRTVDPTILYH